MRTEGRRGVVAWGAAGQGAAGLRQLPLFSLLGLLEKEVNPQVREGLRETGGR